MLEIFHEKKDFFQLKELEKIAPKEKGIIVQSVKEVVQSLVDDNLVDTDKIGTSVYFWSYPTKAAMAKKRQLDALTEQLEEVQKKKKAAGDKLVKVRVGRENCDGREQLVKELEELANEQANVDAELKKYEDSDPEVLEQLQNEKKTFVDAANRWTDNLFALQSWCKNTFNIGTDQLNKNFGIPEELDYIN